MTLSILIWLPLAVALLSAALPAAWARRAALLATLATLGIAISFLVRFHPHRGMQFVTDHMWISALGIHYKLGVDGLNVLLIVLAAILFAGGIFASGLREWDRPRTFYFHFLLAESGVLGAFCAQDVLLFVGFFDLMLIPFYFLIGMWGSGPDRVRATAKLIIYTLVGSLLMLAAAVAAGVIASSAYGTKLDFSLSFLAAHPLAKGSQEWIFLCFAAAFLVKMPSFPFHGWLPDGYKAMPLPALGVFSGVLSKVAAYGFLRIVLPIFPAATVHFQLLVMLIALASILYGSAMAFTSGDARLVIGYSSIAQLGFIVLGIFSLTAQGAQGAVLQMVNHGLVTLPLFLIVGLLAARAGGSEKLRDMGGIAFRAPVLAAIFLIVALANLAMPGSANFVGEFLILLGVFKSKLVIAFVAFAGVVLASVYMLRVLIRALHNRVGPRVESREISLGDGLALVPLVLVILALAVYPQFGLRRSEPSVKASLVPAQIAAGPGAQASTTAGATP